MTGYTLSDASHNPDVTVADEVISSPDHLPRVLESKKQGKGRFLVLCAPDGACLSLGVDGARASVMYEAATGQPPYLWALGPERDWDTDIDFLMGGTPTPVPVARCIPFHQMVDIATSWMRNGHLPSDVEWDED